MLNKIKIFLHWSSRFLINCSNSVLRMIPQKQLARSRPKNNIESHALPPPATSHSNPISLQSTMSARDLSKHVIQSRVLSNQFFSKSEMQRYLIVGHAKLTTTNLKFKPESKHHQSKASLTKSFKLQKNISTLRIKVHQGMLQDQPALRKYYLFFHPLRLKHLTEISFEISDPKTDQHAFLWVSKVLKMIVSRTNIKVFELKISDSLLTSFKIKKLTRIFQLPKNMSIIRLKLRGIEFAQDDVKFSAKQLVSMLFPLQRLQNLTRFSIEYKGTVDVSSYLFRYMHRVILCWMKLEALMICIELDRLEFELTHKPSLAAPYKDFDNHQTKLGNCLKALSITINNVALHAGFSKVLQALETMKALSVFKLNLGNCLIESDSVDRSLMTSLLSLSNLEEFTLSLRQFQSTLTLKPLFEGFAQMRKLRVLKLDLTSAVRWQPVGLAGLAILIKMAIFSNLRELKLNLEKTCVNDEELVEFATSLHLLNKLTSLNLNFSDCNKIKANGIQKLASGLTTLGELKSLNLNFNHCNGFPEKCLAQLLSSFSPLKKCSVLRLGFSNLPFPSGGNIVLQELTKLIPNMDYLRTLAVQLEGSDKTIYNINPEYLIGLVKKLPHKNILEFEIKLEKVSTISETQVRAFCKAIRDLKNLESLKLGMNASSSIAGDLLNDVAKTVSKLEYLCTFELVLGKNKINRQQQLPDFYI